MLSLQDLNAVNDLAEVMTDFYEHMYNVRKQPLHDGQVRAAKEFFLKKRRIIQMQWGRNAGKTECNLYIAWVFALLNPGTETYIITPEIKQGKAIYWSSKRLQQYGPTKYIRETRDSELRLVLTNGSQIVITGCENYESLRGVKPHLVIYDEFQHHSKEFHVEVMQPNLLGNNSCLVVTGTPPKEKSRYYVEFRKGLLEEIKSGDDTRFYMELPTWVNPSMSAAELNKTKTQLYAKGDEKVWLREYEAKMVFGGEEAIFPTWDERKHVRNHTLIMKALWRDVHKLNWYTVCDPGSSSCFGVLFGVHNPYTAQLYIIGELYEKDRKRTDALTMWAAIEEMQRELSKEAKWKVVYDEAAAWFKNEIWKHKRIAIQPTQKRKRKIDDNADDVSLVKSMMSTPDCFMVSHKVEKLPWELDSYTTDENGKYPDVNDHLIQCLLYMVAAAKFKLHEDPEKKLFVSDPYAKSEYFVNNQSMQAKNWADKIVEQSLEQCADYYDA